MLDAIATFIIEVLGELIIYSIPRFLGVCTKWLFYGGKKRFKDIRKESWNGRLGLAIIILIVAILIFINS